MSANDLLLFWQSSFDTQWNRWIHKTINKKVYNYAVMMFLQLGEEINLQGKTQTIYQYFDCRGEQTLKGLFINDIIIFGGYADPPRHHSSLFGYKDSLLKNIHPWKYSPPEIYSPLKIIHPWKIFAPEKYSPLRNVQPWKIFTLEKYLPLENIHL